DATNKNARKLMEDSHFLFDSESAKEMHICSRCANGDHSASKTVNFYGTQSNRLSDAISVKRGELLRIADLLKARQNGGDIASRYHYKDLILRINTALGL
ncbi:MAG: peptidase M10A/M12B, partial [Bacteroidales bacterium]